MAGSIHDLLRALPTLNGSAPPFGPCSAPDDPAALSLTWLDDALAAGSPSRTP